MHHRLMRLRSKRTSETLITRARFVDLYEDFLESIADLQIPTAITLELGHRCIENELREIQREGTKGEEAKVREAFDVDFLNIIINFFGIQQITYFSCVRILTKDGWTPSTDDEKIWVRDKGETRAVLAPMGEKMFARRLSIDQATLEAYLPHSVIYKPHPQDEVVFTTAPRDYDYKNTVIVTLGSFEHEGRTWRKIILRGSQSQREQQKARFSSGLHPSWNQDPRQG